MAGYGKIRLWITNKGWDRSYMRIGVHLSLEPHNAEVMKKAIEDSKSVFYKNRSLYAREAFNRMEDEDPRVQKYLK